MVVIPLLAWRMFVDMKTHPKLPLPWDILVFLTVTTAGLGFTVKNSISSSPTDFSAKVNSISDSPAFASSGAVYDLGCIERRVKESITLSRGSLRLRGKFCDSRFSKREPAATLRLRNLTNGTEGTVFFQGDPQSFITDRVQLAPGKKNIIQIEWNTSGLPRSNVFVAEVFDK